jgi:hypothetical protein
MEPNLEVLLTIFTLERRRKRRSSFFKEKKSFLSFRFEMAKL